MNLYIYKSYWIYDLDTLNQASESISFLISCSNSSGLLRSIANFGLFDGTDLRDFEKIWKEKTLTLWSEIKMI